jgi:hypothetical protein
LSKARPPYESLAAYAAIAAFCAGAYLVVLGPYIRFVSSVLPKGDPFTYTIGYFKLLDLAHDGHWRAAAWMVLTGRWDRYWLTDSLVLVLSPFLAKEPYSIAVMNFIVYGFATAALFHLGRRFGLRIVPAFLLALVIWSYPVNYGFYDYSSIAVLGLDSAFTGALYMALAMTLAFAMAPHDRGLALLCGVCAGLAIWGRGNSLPVVGMCLTVPGLVLLARARGALRRREPRIATNVLIAGAASTVLAAYYYVANWETITTYYAAHASFFQRHAWNLADATPYLLNIPGFMFWRAEGRPATIALSMVLHGMVVATLLAAFRARFPVYIGGEPGVRFLAATGAFIYFVTFATNLALFTDPVMNLHNALLIWRPMLVGLTAVAFAWGVWYLRKAPDRFASLRWMAIACALMLVYAHFWNKKLTPRDWSAGRPTPRMLERVTADIDAMLENRPLSWLYYGNYSPQMIQYYSQKLLRRQPLLHMDEHNDHIWSAWDYGPENRARVVASIRGQLRKAGLVVIPEYWNSYVHTEPYALYRFREDISALFREPGTPSFRVRALLEDRPGVRLLVLQPATLAKGRGELFTEWKFEIKGPLPSYGADVAVYPLR